MPTDPVFRVDPTENAGATNTHPPGSIYVARSLPAALGALNECGSLSRASAQFFLTKDKGWVVCNVYDRNRLPIGSSSPGPALIEEPTTTTFVPSDQRFARDETGQLIMWSPSSSRQSDPR